MIPKGAECYLFTVDSEEAADILNGKLKFLRYNSYPSIKLNKYIYGYIYVTKSSNGLYKTSYLKNKFKVESKDDFTTTSSPLNGKVIARFKFKEATDKGIKIKTLKYLKNNLNVSDFIAPCNSLCEQCRAYSPSEDRCKCLLNFNLPLLKAPSTFRMVYRKDAELEYIWKYFIKEKDCNLHKSAIEYKYKLIRNLEYLDEGIERVDY